MVEFSHVSITNDFGDYVQYPDVQNKEISKLNKIREYYLIDLKMMGTGELSTEGGDLSITGGLNNLAQALTHRLMTDRGTHPMDKTLGVPWSSYIGQSYVDDEIIQYELMQEIAAEVYKDIRVQEIISIDVSFIDIYAIKVEIVVAPTGMGSTFGIALQVQDTGG